MSQRFAKEVISGKASGAERKQDREEKQKLSKGATSGHVIASAGSYSEQHRGHHVRQFSCPEEKELGFILSSCQSLVTCSPIQDIALAFPTLRSMAKRAVVSQGQSFEYYS